MTLAKAASPQVTRTAREKEWGPSITAAYYEFMYAKEDDLEDDWQRRVERHGPDDDDPLGEMLPPCAYISPDSIHFHLSDLTIRALPFPDSHFRAGIIYTTSIVSPLARKQLTYLSAQPRPAACSYASLVSNLRNKPRRYYWLLSCCFIMNSNELVYVVADGTTCLDPGTRN